MIYIILALWPLFGAYHWCAYRIAMRKHPVLKPTLVDLVVMMIFAPIFTALAAFERKS